MTDESKLRENVARVETGAEVEAVFSGEAMIALVPKPLND